MGNWRTVNITGTMSAADAARLREELDWGDYLTDRRGIFPTYDPLTFSSVSPGLSGLGVWPAETVNRCGNLHERDYTVEDVYKALEVLVAVAPSMLLTVHCGGEYESDECVATILVGEGLVVTREPAVATIAAPSTEQMLGNLAANLWR